MTILSVISIVMIVLDYAKSIDITAYPYDLFDNSILAIFAIDYFTRLILAKDKRRFLITNIWDLLSIIPANQIFYFFRVARIARLFRLLKLLRLLRLVGLSGRLRKFINTNGLIYYIYISIVVLIIGAAMYSISEKVDFVTALWWSITTATTVGFGIGFIGMLTSSISNFFIANDDVDLKDELDKLHKENDQLNDKLDKLEQIIRGQQ